MFHYVSGFFGYMLIGFYMRKFAGAWSWGRTLSCAIPLWLVGYATVFIPFFVRIPDGMGYPVSAPYAMAVSLEVSWDFASTGVALTALAYFLVIRKFVAEGSFYRHVIRPLADASYGTYLIHMLVLAEVSEWLNPRVTAPVAIMGTAFVTFVAASLLSMGLKRIPKLGPYLCG